MRTEYLLQREVDQVLSVLTDRNRLIMRTALHTGLRIGDILKLETAQLKPHFWVTETKIFPHRLTAVWFFAATARKSPGLSRLFFQI